ncbi:hypothetical protein ACF0H5_001366 [Mactra antiquata]
MRSFLLLALLGIVYGAPAQQSGLCEVCHLLVGEVQDLFTTGQTQSTILNYVQNSCSKLPTEEKDTCLSFIRDNSLTIFDKLSHDLSPHDFCMKLDDVCLQYEEPEEEEVPSVTGNPLECELCKLIVLGIDKIIIGSNKSASVVNKTLEKFCDDLPAQVSGICKMIEPLVLKAITSGLEPEAACKFATLCLADVEEGSSQITCDVCHSAMNAIGIEDTGLVCVADRTCKEDEVVVEPTQIAEPVIQAPLEEVEPEVQDTLECQICKFAIQAVDEILGTNRSVAAVNDTLMKVCNSLPDELKSSCVNVEPEILKAILGGIDPTKACDFLKICNDASKGFTEIPCDVCKNTLEAVAGEAGLAICYKFEDICAPVEDDYRAVAVEADAECELCKFVVQLLDNALANGGTVEKVNATLITICNSLPDTYKPICLGLVPQIDSIIASGVDPTTACTAINFCTANDKSLTLTDELKCAICETLTEKLPVDEAVLFKSEMCIKGCHERSRRSIVETIGDSIKSEFECEICHAVIQTLEELIGKNATVDQINNTIYEICERLTGKQLQDICLQEAPKALPLLENGLDANKTCIAVKLCTAGYVDKKTETNVKDVVTDSPLMNAIEEKMTKNVGDLKCEICEALIDLLDSYITDNATDDKINATLLQLCSSLPSGEFRDVCMQYEPQIMAAIEKGFDPPTTCQTAGLCAAKKELTLSDVSTDALLQQYLKQKNDKNVGDIKCDICEGVVELVDKYIEDNATDEKINETLYQICSSLPDGAFKDICKEQVPTIMKIIESGGFDPQTVCTKAGLCNGFLADYEEEDIPIPENEDPRNLRDLKCTVCEEVIKEIDSLVAQNETIAKINETIYDVCSKLTGALQNLCLQAAPTILQAIEAGADPESTCTAIGLCSSVQDYQTVTDNQVDIKCDICEFIISEMDKILADNATDAKINATIYSLCTRFSGAAQLLCRNLAPLIVQQVEAGVNPTDACRILTLCPQRVDDALDVAVNEIEDVFVEETSDDEQVDIKCDVCEFLIGEMDKILADNATDQAINASIYAVCGSLPALFQPICTNIAPGLVNIIEAGIDPTAGCQVLTLCPTAIQYDVPLDIEEEDVAMETLDCELCRKSLQSAYNEIDEMKIESVLLRICSNMPLGFKEQCENLVNENGGKYLKMVLEQYTPTSLCEIAHCYENGEPGFNGSS